MPLHMYVSVSREDRIARFVLDEATGKMEPVGDVAVSGRPAPLALDPSRRFMFVGRRGSRQLSSFRVAQGSGEVEEVSIMPLESDPCYLSTDRKGRFVLSAYYAAGGAAVHRVQQDGALEPEPIEWLKTGTGAHCFQTDPTNRFAFLPHIAGPDRPNAIFQYQFDERTGRLTPSLPPVLRPERPVGPRHFCFHPSKNVLYFSNEQGCSVTAYRLDPSSGTLTAFQTVSTLPEGYQGQNSCSQIQIAPSGKFLYAPNRGHNSIACFSVDEAGGELTPLGHAPSERIPRAFSLSPDGRFLVAAGLESGRLASYRVSQDTGLLEPLEVLPVGREPMWVLITSLSE